MLRVVMLTGSEVLGQAFHNVLPMLLGNTTIEVSSNVTKTTFTEVDIAIVDLAYPCDILGEHHTSDIDSFLDTIQTLSAKQRKDQGTIPCLLFRNPDASQDKRLLLSYLLHEIVQVASSKRLRKDQTMSSYGTAPLWHDLKNGDRIDYRLELLEEMGYGHKADKYRQLLDENPEQAREYASGEYKKALPTGASRISAHKSLSDSSSLISSGKKNIGILLVDDQKDWFYKLEEQVEGFNATSDEYAFTDVRFCSNSECAKKAVMKLGLHAVVLDYALGHANGEPETSILLSKEIKDKRPDLSIFGLTGVLPPAPDTFDWAVDRVFYKSDAAEIHELLLAIIEVIRHKTKTPYFSALCECARRPTAVFHAMPLSRAKSVAGSQWTREFAEFYGEGYFAGETSSTMAPLDSLFHPKNSLREAMKRAAKTFSADKTLFVTNGTTGGNSLVYAIHINPGDLVLLDRNCHRSHHYSAIQCGAQVVYMEPEHIDNYGISSLVPMDRILETVKQHAESAKMLVLTHPTFDGVCYSPYVIMNEVMKIKDDIVFLFDEAWFAYGILHHELRDRSAMAASQRLRRDGFEPRLYVTQSIHKTLSAMRQGSMIHIREPQFTKEIESSIEESQNTHISTSPNAHVLASLDVARMQADIEGYDRISQAFDIARWIRNEFSDREKPVYALSHDDLINPLLKEEGLSYLDPLKITFVVNGMPAAKFKKDEMYGNMGIQTNKYSQNTFLALVTIGTTWSMADHLVRSLRRWQPDDFNQNGQELKIPSFSGFAERFWGRNNSIGNISFASSEARRTGTTESKTLKDCENKTSAVFVIPYPPGYPILVPGQIIDDATIKYIQSLLKAEVEINDIHGMEENECLRVFK